MDKRIIKGKETKGSIISAAITLFSNNGYDGTSIKNITDKAGVPKSLFYHYYKSKEGLLEDIIQSFDLQITGNEKALSESNPINYVVEKITSRIHMQTQSDIDMLKIIILESLKNDKILRILMKKTDQLGEGFSSFLPDSIKKNYTMEEMNVFRFYFRFIPEMMFAFTKEIVSQYYGIPQDDLNRYFMKLLSYNPYLNNTGDNV